MTTMASPVECVSGNKRVRKANYADSEICVLLEEVLLARVVLFGSFNNKITIQEKNIAWDRVTSAINSCGIAKRSRVEIKEKWKTLKSEVIGHQRRAMKTGGGPPEAAVPYEDMIMQIIGAESNVIHGVTAPWPASFVRPSVVTGDSEMGFSQTQCPTTTEEELISCTPSQGDCGTSAASASFSMGHIRRPMCSSTPLPQASPTEPITVSLPLSLPVDVSSAVVVGDLQDANITVSSHREHPEYRADGSRRWAGRRRWQGPLSRRLRNKSTHDTTSDMEERAAFIDFLKSSSDNTKAKTKLLEAQYDSERLNTTRIKAQTLLLEVQHRRELLEIKKLEKEVGKSD